MKVLLVNGISTHGEGNVDRVGDALRRRGMTVDDLRLPKRHFISARWGARSDAEIIVNRANPGDIVVAHSFGCLRAAHAERVMDFGAVFAIAAAMERNWEWRRPWIVKAYHSKDDLALHAGKFLILHPFGRAGLDGFKQLGVHNIRWDRLDHSDYFYGVWLDRLTSAIEVEAVKLGWTPPPDGG